MNKEGFTLVELVVAIAILGVITLIALPTINAIQANNKKTKYIAYEKSIKAASKAYVDAFDEDLYGGTNYGCAIVKYSEMKEKDLISDLQIKGEKCDNDNDTFIYVLKDKQGNFGYFSNIVCRHGSEKVYSHRDDNRTSCKLETGDPPKIDVIFKPQKTTYYIGDHPKASIKISDEVGLKANQELDYVWINVTTGKEITSKKTVKFENIHFKQRVTKDIDMPTEILNETMRDPTKYMLKVTGNVYDVNLNKTEANIEKPLNYFVGALLIKYKAGGAKMINPHGAPYTVNASNDYVVRNGNDYNISKIRYKESKDLWDYNNKDYINIRKDHYHMVDKEEWKWGTKVFSQQEKLTVKKFNYEDEDIRKENKTIEVVANWKIDTFKLTYDDNGGSGCSDKGVTRDWNQKWDSNCTPKWDGHTFGGWEVDGKTLQPATISATSATKDLKAKAKWTQNYVNIYFGSNTGSIDKTTTNGSRYSIANGFIYMDGSKLKYSIKYGDKLNSSGLPDNNSPTWLRLLKTGHHIDPATAWSKNANGSGGSYDQTKPLPASDFCNAKVSSCDVTIYANWRKNQYTLTYDDNGGSGCSSQSIKKYYNEKWDSLCTSKRDGYTFNGWKDKDTGTAVTSNTIALKNTKIVAQWTEIPKPPKYTLTYDDNGGSGCSSKSITQTENLAWGTLCTPTWAGHAFNGWKDGSTTVNSTSKATKNVKVKADWTTTTYTITYMRNTSSTDTTNTTGTKVHNQTYTIANNSWSNSGKVFLGWATVANATASSGTWYDPSDSYKTNGALKLFAQWYDVKSLEENYTQYVQSGDLTHHVSKNKNNTYVTIGNYYNWDNSFNDDGNVIGISGVQAANVRPYKHEPTLVRVRAQYTTSRADGFQNYLTFVKRSSNSYTDNVDKRIDRLQKMDDVVLRYSDFKIKRCVKDNQSYTYNTDNSAVVTCSPDSGYSIISAAGVKVTNGTSSGYNVGKSYIIQMSKGNDIGNTYGCSGASNGCVRVAVAKNNTSVKLKIESDFLEVKTRKVRTTTFAPTSGKGLARYKALVALSNNGHASNCFPASYIKTAKVNMSMCGTLNDWGENCESTKAISLSSGAILGVVGWDLSNNPSTWTGGAGTGESYGLPVVARLASDSTRLTNTAVSRYFVGNAYYNDSTAETMKNVRMNVHVRYVSSGTLSQ